MSLALPPSSIGTEMDAARLLLNELLMKYHTQLHGVLLAYARVRPDTRGSGVRRVDGGAYVRSGSTPPAPLGRMLDEFPVLHVRIRFDALLMRVAVGDYVHARVNAVHSGHVSALIGGVFSASITKEHLAGAYVYDDARAAFVAVEETAAPAAGTKRPRAALEASSEAKQMLIAANPSVIAVDSIIVFKVRQLTYSATFVMVDGTLDADDSGAAPSVAPVPATVASAAAAAAQKGAQDAQAAATEAAAPPQEKVSDKPVKKAKRVTIADHS